MYLWACLGYASHGLLDACTSYGTYLLWPLTDTRYAWNWISVIDPIYTVPLAILLAVSVWRQGRRSLGLAWIWLVAYMTFGAVQNHRAEQIVADWARQSGLTIERLVAKPAFANLILWRGLVDDGQRFHLVAVRNLPGSDTLLWSGGSVARFARPEGLIDGQLTTDLDRFDHFSSDWLFRYPDYDAAGEWFIGDFRYAIDPASQRPLWGIVFNPEDPDSRARYTTPRRVTEEERAAFFQRLRGDLVHAAPSRD